MSGIKPMSRGTATVAGLIAVAWVIVIALLVDFYFQWEMLETFGRALLSWL
jgi:hypothetical protein